MANARYIRYIIFALFVLTLIFFISSSSAPAQVSHHIQSTTNTLKDSFKKKTHGSDLKTQPVNKVDPSEFALHNIPPDGEDEEFNPPRPVDPAEPSSFDSKLGLDSNKGRGRMNATFVTLARNEDLYDLARSIKEIEDRFNHNYHYDWVFLNEKEFDDDFKKLTTSLTSGRARYGLIPPEHWSFPEWIDQAKAARVRQEMHDKKIIYGDSISYRHMCRFESGFFFRQPLMLEYEWYWRVEPGIRYYCDIDYDVFEYMATNKKKYSFTLSLFEYKETIETLWDSVKGFMGKHPEHLASDNSMEFITEDNGKTYNGCHFWSNFEIGNLDWLRSDAYIDYFTHLDQEGGFFYERWGDAPVHSIAAALLLQKDEIHFFEDIGYYHVPFHHCPNDENTRLKKRCRCDPEDNFDWNGYSCTAKFYDMHGWDHPDQT